MTTMLEQLLQDFEADYQDLDRGCSLGLYSGRSGMLLLQTLRLVKGDHELEEEDKFVWHLEEILKELKDAGNAGASFSNGLAGIGWLLIYLSDIDFLEKNETLFKDLDHILTVALEAYLKNDDFDLLHGATGIGLYFLKRRNFNNVEKVYRKLVDTVYNLGDGIYWMRYDKYHQKDYIIDIGLAHGVPGMLYFINCCRISGFNGLESEKLINKGIRFLIDRIQDKTVVGSYFANSLKGDFVDNSKTEFSRLAWCYGDLGILFTLFHISVRKKDKTFFLNLLLQTTKRTTVEATLVTDPSFCHGSCGLTIIYAELYRYTNLDSFKLASIYWKEKSSEFYNDKDSKKYGNGLLMGRGGYVLMELLDSSAILSEEPYSKWKEVFFL